MDELARLAALQKVRLWDIYALGPFLVWYAWKSKGMGKWSRRALFASGMYTIVYNFKNYANFQKDITARLEEAQKGLAVLP